MNPGVSATLRRQLTRRDGTCAWTGCSATHHLAAHHVQHSADGGPTVLSNLALLCVHHHRVLHAHAYQLVRDAKTKTWQVKRPDGTIIDSTPAHKIVPRNALSPTTPEPQRLQSQWDGTPLDTLSIQTLWIEPINRNDN